MAGWDAGDSSIHCHSRYLCIVCSAVRTDGAQERVTCVASIRCSNSVCSARTSSATACTCNSLSQLISWDAGGTCTPLGVQVQHLHPRIYLSVCIHLLAAAAKSELDRHGGARDDAGTAIMGIIIRAVGEALLQHHHHQQEDGERDIAGQQEALCFVGAPPRPRPCPNGSDGNGTTRLL